MNSFTCGIKELISYYKFAELVYLDGVGDSYDD